MSLKDSIITLILFLLMVSQAYAQRIDAHSTSIQSVVKNGFKTELPDLTLVSFSERQRDWTENLSVFVGLDGSKQPQDVGIHAHFGGRAAVNLGLPIFPDRGIGIQVGSAMSATDAAVAVLEAVDGTDSRFQSLSTVGLFQRSDAGFQWAVVWDILHQSYYDDITLNQLRARIDVNVTEMDTIGIQGMWSMGDTQNAQVAGTTVRLSPIDQISAIWGHEWESGAVTEGWLGIADSHGEVVHVFPGNPRRSTAALFGASIRAPLTEKLALYGQGNFILPADSGTVDAYLGVVYTFGKSHCSKRNRFAPILDVAGSTSFAVDLAR